MGADSSDTSGKPKEVHPPVQQSLMVPEHDQVNLADQSFGTLKDVSVIMPEYSMILVKKSRSNQQRQE